MPSYRLFLLGLCSLGLMAPMGCSRSVTRPATVDVQLALSTVLQSTESGPAFELSAKVGNAGTTRVWHCEGCGCGNGITIDVLGPDGKQVLLLDPRRLMPLCPDGPAALEPGGGLASGLTFNGRLYVPDSPILPTPTYAAPPGTYTVVAEFSYNTQQQWMSAGSALGIERRATFTWPPPTP